MSKVQVFQTFQVYAGAGSPISMPQCSFHAIALPHPFAASPAGQNCCRTYLTTLEATRRRCKMYFSWLLLNECNNLDSSIWMKTRRVIPSQTPLWFRSYACICIVCIVYDGIYTHTYPQLVYIIYFISPCSCTLGTDRSKPNSRRIPQEMFFWVQ